MQVGDRVTIKMDQEMAEELPKGFPCDMEQYEWHKGTIVARLMDGRLRVRLGDMDRNLCVNFEESELVLGWPEFDEIVTAGYSAQQLRWA
jgi:hypothetical protein